MATRGPYDSNAPEGAPTTLGARVRLLRLGLGWTQDELARAVNTDQTTVSGWERDKARPSGPSLAALTQILGLPSEWLEAEGDLRMPAPGPPPRNLALPEREGAFALVMDLRSGTHERLDDPMKAMQSLMDAAQNGRGVWLVVE